MAQIHPTAIVDSGAELGRDVVIGPFCIVEADTVIGDGCRLEARAIVKGRTTLGKNNEIGEGAVLGAGPTSTFTFPAAGWLLAKIIAFARTSRCIAAGPTTGQQSATTIC